MSNRSLSLVYLLSLLCIFPAVLFVASASIRLLEPTQYQPAHAALLIFQWFASSSGVTRGMMLLVLPALALVGSVVVVVQGLRQNQAVQQDVVVLGWILLRQWSILVGGIGLLVSGFFWLLLVTHMLAG